MSSLDPSSNIHYNLGSSSRFSIKHVNM